jgi:hypothetical protein
LRRFIWALWNTGLSLLNKDNQETYEDLRSDAKKAIWTFLIINICVVLLALGGERQFVIVAIFVQSALVVFWLLPVFLYQVLVNKQVLALSVLKALASYRNLMGQVQWP